MSPPARIVLAAPPYQKPNASLAESLKASRSTCHSVWLSGVTATVDLGRELTRSVRIYHAELVLLDARQHPMRCQVVLTSRHFTG